MTEAEWLACTEPDDLLQFLRDQASDRQLRLFVCACCRRLLPWLQGKRKAALALCEKALEVSEKYADGLVDQATLTAALPASAYYSVTAGPGILAAEVARRTLHVQLAGNERPMRFGRRLIGHPASEAAEFARSVVSSIAGETKDRSGKAKAARKRTATLQEKAFQVELLRDLFGNPFQSVVIDSGWLAWNGGTVVHLAQGIYNKRRFTDMPILADALEEAGCTEPDILPHCRQPGPHVRGCWLIDLLTGTG
jgi:hypothetical protein